MKVLVADDSAEAARRVTDLLEEAGDIVVVGPAQDGADAVRLFAAQAPEAVVLDLRMPVLDGLAALKAMKRIDPSCVVVMLTNHTEPSMRQACLDAGAAAVLHKCRDFERLVEVVRGHAHGA